MAVESGKIFFTPPVDAFFLAPQRLPPVFHIFSPYGLLLLKFLILSSLCGERKQETTQKEAYTA